MAADPSPPDRALAPGSFRRLPRLAFRKLGDQTVILNPPRREVHLLNGTGALIWELLADARSVDQLVAALLEANFDGDPERMSRDVATFVAGLADKGLLQVER